MRLNKREFLKLTSAAAGVAGLSATASCAPTSDAPALESIIGDAEPIAVTEREARVAKAQRLMADHDIDAIVVEPGSAMDYFCGVQWWRSERLTALVIPQVGEIGVVTPFFEEPSVRESLAFGADVRTWHEHEDPFSRVAGILADRNIRNGRIGLEETVRYFIADGLMRAVPSFEITSATPVTLGCRMYKSPAEIALMRMASEVTMTAYRHVYERLAPGMTPVEVGAMMKDAQSALGGSRPWALVLFGPASAYPHGTGQPQAITEGEIVLMDCGCAVHGYQSDISRTLVLGGASKRQREVWDTVRNGQQIAFDAAQPGTPAGTVDDQVRAYYESLGYGPGYQTPGLSHRTGHGIGMDGHERINFVHGEETRLAAGMCLSNEPGLYIFDEFGVRLEDCLYMTETGPEWFTVPPDTIDAPLGRMGS